jgi:transposase
MKRRGAICLCGTEWIGVDRPAGVNRPADVGRHGAAWKFLPACTGLERRESAWTLLPAWTGVELRLTA